MPGSDAATILLVEDEVLIRFDLADEFRSAGFEVIEAKNAAEALSILQTDSIRLDLMLTDVNMPGGMDGLELCRWTAQHRPEIVLAVTSAQPESLTEARGICQPDLIFPKPASTQAMVRSFRRACRDVPPENVSQLKA